MQELANDALNTLELPSLVRAEDIEVIASNAASYGVADASIRECVHLMATKEGLVADPVYEGRAVRGLLDLNAAGRFHPDDRILLMHLGGTPAIHAYAEQFGTPDLIPFSSTE